MLNRKSTRFVRMEKRSTSPEAAGLVAPPQQAFCPGSPHGENLSLSRAKPMLLLVCSYARFDQRILLQTNGATHSNPRPASSAAFVKAFAVSTVLSILQSGSLYLKRTAPTVLEGEGNASTTPARY